MKKRIIISICIVIILLAGAAIAVPIIQDNAEKVTFEDARMKREIGHATETSEDDFRAKDLDKVKCLEIEYTGKYSTLVDIEKCQQLEKLEVGKSFDLDAEAYGYKEHSFEPESKEKIQQIKKELGNILENCPKLESLDLIGQEKYFELCDVSFLKNGKRLRSLAFRYQPELDYSALSECSHLRTLVFQGCEISKLDMLSSLNELECLEVTQGEVAEAGDIVKLQSLTELILDDTVLAGNEEQLELIFENCPNIKKLTLVYGKRSEGLSNLDFLKKAGKLEELTLIGQPAMDYSAISECYQLKSLGLLECNISDFSILNGLENLESINLTATNIPEAKDLLNLKNLKELDIISTPLAENEEQLALLYQQFPDIDIYTGMDDFGN